jgi:biopolymer transport protein ExbD
VDPKKKEMVREKRLAIQRQRRLALMKPVYLNLTSMVDMFTIIVVFLLVSYSVSDVALAPPKDVRLPVSSSSTLPFISLKVVVSPRAIMIEDRPVVALNQGKLRQDDVQGMVIYPLYRELKAIMVEREKSVEGVANAKPVDRKVVLQGDRSIPFDTVKRILFTAGQAEYDGFRLSVIRKGMGF